MLKRSVEVMQHWATKLAIPENILADSGVQIVRNATGVKPDRVLVYRTGKTTLLLLPSQFEEALVPLLAQTLPTALVSGELPPTLPLRPRWRDYIYYRDLPFSNAVLAEPMRVLSQADAEPLAQLQNACSERERQLGQISIEDPLLVGYFVAEALVGVASFLYEAEGAIADVGVLVRPEFRGRGIACVLVQNLANQGLAQGRIIQYMTMATNQGSVRTAEKSGFALFFIEDGFEFFA